MKKIFMSYPMNGKSDEEIKKTRDWMIKKLTAIYGTYIDVVDNSDCEIKENAGRLWYLGQAIQKMDGVDTVAFHPGWMEARGCIVEREVAKQYGLEVIYVQDVVDHGVSDLLKFINDVRAGNAIVRNGITDIYEFARFDFNRNGKDLKKIGKKSLELLIEKQKDLRYIFEP